MRKCNFIKAEGKIYVTSPSSWLGGWARHMWLERYFGKGNVRLAGAERWAELVLSGRPVRVLIEENNQYREEVAKTS